MRFLLPNAVFLHCDYNPSFKGQAPEPIHRNLQELSDYIKTHPEITCGLANGTIQVPPNVQPILLLVDRQTIGGYPVIATMIHADLSLVAQSAPGDEFRFSAVSPEEGREAFIRLWGSLDRFKRLSFSGQLSA